MVRSGKIEDIRRLISGAIGMCDSKELAGTKKLLGSAVRSLAALEEDRKIKRRSEETLPKRSFVNPGAALAEIENMIRKEKEKTILPEEDGLING